MKQQSPLERAARAVTHWIGSTSSLVIHTLIFIASFFTVVLGILSLDRMLLVLTTIVSLEAIYLSLFIQMTINFQAEDIDEIQEDVGEIQEDIDEIQEDVDELQEDVEDIEESDDADAARDAAQQKALGVIQNDLRKLMDDIGKLKRT